MIFEKARERLEEEKQRLRKLKNDTITLFDSEVIAIEEQSYNFCKEIINQVEAEYNNGWISVENELPEKFDSVLVSCEGNIVGGTHEGEKCEFVATGYMFSKDHWQIQGHDDVKYIKVIYWQPLPQPPKGE